MKSVVMKSKLGMRVVIFIVAVCAVFGFLFVYICTDLYSQIIANNYIQFGHKVTNLVSGCFTENELKEYADVVFKYNRSQLDESKVNEIVNSDRYKTIFDQVNSIRDDLNFNDICVFVVDLDVLNSYNEKTTNVDEWNPLYYIVDTNCNDYVRQPFAQKDRFSIKYANYIKDNIGKGENHSTNFIQNGRYGYTVTASNSVFKDENIVIDICCDISIESYQKGLMHFVLTIAIFVSVLMLILICVSLFVISRYFIKPVIFIANEVKNFEGNDGWSLSSLEAFHTGDEIELLAKSIVKMQQNMFEYMDDSINKAINLKKVRTELNLAKSIQKDMLPVIFPESTKRNNFDLDASMTPAKEVGGDFYDFFFIDDDHNHLALVIADVSDKGVPAALFMVITKTLIKDRVNIRIPGESYSPAEILRHVNEQLCENNKNELFVTVWLAIIDMQTGECVSANAGHEYPAICRKGEKYELIKDKHSPAVATIEGIKFKDQKFKLNSGDSLFVYTDGVTEATNADGELFGEERLVDVLNRDGEASASDILKNVREDVDKFVGNAPQFDDLTMVCFKYYGKDGHR